MGPHVQAFASDTKQAIQTLQASIQTLHHEIAEERELRLAQCHKQLVFVDLGDKVNAAKLEAFVGQPLIYRLRWLIFGR